MTCDPLASERSVCRLRKLAASGGGRIVTLSLTALCSARRWEKFSVWRTNLVNQAVMLWYRFGATPEQVFEFYYGMPAPTVKPHAAPAAEMKVE